MVCKEKKWGQSRMTLRCFKPSNLEDRVTFRKGQKKRQQKKKPSILDTFSLKYKHRYVAGK